MHTWKGNFSSIFNRNNSYRNWKTNNFLNQIGNVQMVYWKSKRPNWAMIFENYRVLFFLQCTCILAITLHFPTACKNAYSWCLVWGSDLYLSVELKGTMIHCTVLCSNWLGNVRLLHTSGLFFFYCHLIVFY